MKLTQKYGLAFFLLLVCQLFLSNYNCLGPYIMLTMLPTMILCLPTSMGGIISMLIAFACGFFTDLFAEGMLGHGADVLTYHEVTAVVKEGDRVVGVEVYDVHAKEKKTLRSRLVINAGGIWGHHIAQLAGATVNMFPAKGALLIFGHRVNNLVINRCRKPADADILVPGDTICLIGTTSSRLPYDQIDDMKVTADEVDLLLREGEKLAPELAYTRILRAYAGVRPLVAADNDPSGRSISRGIVCLDHETRDGIPGFITITGGKLMTYRLMAEWATDLACKKLGVDKKCQTAEICLPGSEEAKKEKKSKKQTTDDNNTTDGE